MAKTKQIEQIDIGRHTGKYEVKADEKDSIHVELEQVKFDRETGEKTSRPFIQKYSKAAWVGVRKSIHLYGYQHVKVLHAPQGSNKLTLVQEQQAKAAEAAKAAQAAKDQEQATLVANIEQALMERLHKEGLLKEADKK